MGLEFKAKPSKRDIAHVGGLVTFSNIPAAGFARSSQLTVVSTKQGRQGGTVQQSRRHGPVHHVQKTHPMGGPP
jgi:hypothetical protein